MTKEAENGIDFEIQEIEKNKKPVQNKSLFNIQEDFNDLMRTIEEAEGEITPEMENALKINENELQKKGIGYLEVIKQKEAFNLLVDNEIKRLQGLKKTNSNSIERLKDSLLNAVNLFGEFTIGTITFKTRKSQRVIITDEEMINKKYKVVKVSEVINKVEIKKAIKDGTVVLGAEIQDNFSLMIK